MDGQMFALTVAGRVANMALAAPNGFSEEIIATKKLVTTKQTQALVSDFLRGTR